MIAWEAAAGPTVRRQGSRCARPAPPARGLDGAPLGITVTVHQTIVNHGSTTSRRPPVLAFELMTAFEFRRLLVLDGTHAE